ncbi:LacI family DNA-binding transcriptional regulator [Actinomadura syzygii]|uniref:LacI family DNA-binding transcriptional regulator n=1 Tax=Actinomadura syzygii TaxID=1427538 RepID=UPI003612CC81
MAYVEKRGSGANAYYIACFSDGRGKWPTVKNPGGETQRFNRKRDAQKAGDDTEAEVRAGQWSEPNDTAMTFESWVNMWYVAQDLALSSMQNLRRHCEDHLLPEFEKDDLGDIDAGRIATWVARERAAGYAANSINAWRKTLHTILADATDPREVERILGRPPGSRTTGLIRINPATRRRGRGKRAGLKRDRGPEKEITDDLGALLIAERASLLTGRDNELVMVLLAYYTGLRWAETVGLEARYVRPGRLRVEWQLWEDNDGVFHRIPPKDDSYRDIDLPPWLSNLLSDHITRTAPKPCPCHGGKYVFRNRESAARPRGPATAADVARRAGVSVGTVSNVVNHPGRVAEGTRTRVEAGSRNWGSRVRRRPRRACRVPGTGAGQGSPRGYSARPPRAGTPKRRPSPHGPCHCWPTRSPADRCAGATRGNARRCAGCRSPRA